MKAWRASLLRFGEDDALERIDDALLVAEGGRIVDVGEAQALAARWAGVPVEDWRGRVIAPGFIDLHAHVPQLDVIGAASDGLLDWLEHRALPEEARFADPAHAAAVAGDFLDELLRNGVTAALLFGSAHAHSADAVFEAARARRMRVIAGPALMDCGAGAGPGSATLADVDALAARWHGRGRLGVAITPRFVLSCSDAMLAGAAALAAGRDGLWVQTHAAENRDEVARVAQRCPRARSYVDVYARAGLLGARTVLAHCIHVDDADRAQLAAAGTAIAVCPGSNQFLGSGLFDFAAADRAGLRWALASDVGAGTSFSPFRTMLAAFEVGRLGGVTLAPQALWRRHTLDAARALGLAVELGDLAPGLSADFVVLDPRATPLLARRTAAAGTLDDWLFAMIVLADDRAVSRSVVAGEVVGPGEGDRPG